MSNLAEEIALHDDMVGQAQIFKAIMFARNKK